MALTCPKVWHLVQRLGVLASGDMRKCLCLAVISFMGSLHESRATHVPGREWGLLPDSAAHLRTLLSAAKSWGLMWPGIPYTLYLYVALLCSPMCASSMVRLCAILIGVFMILLIFSVVGINIAAPDRSLFRVMWTAPLVLLSSGWKKRIWSTKAIGLAKP